MANIDPQVQIPNEIIPIVNVLQNGWTPVFEFVDRANLDGSVDVVVRIKDWTGGVGSKPPIGIYVGSGGFVSSIAGAKNIRGTRGAAGLTEDEIIGLVFAFASQNTVDEVAVNSLIQSYFNGQRPSLYPWSGYKMITLGDSITEGNQWQPLLVSWQKVSHNVPEMLNGASPGRPTAIGGTTISPIFVAGGSQPLAAGKSIYSRADDIATYYAPANDKYIITVMGGYNDGLTLGPQGNELGTVNDAPYEGPEVASTDLVKPTFSASYKGLLKKLAVQNPLAKIFAIIPYDNNASFNTPNTVLDQKEEIMLAACKQFNIQVINAKRESGINPANVGLLLGDGTHINGLGGIVFAQTLNKYF